MSLPALKKRIQTIQNTIKITKVMQMIANSKLQECQKKFSVSKEIFQKVSSIDIRIPKIKNANKKLLIFFGSDSGFCGSINSAVLKKLSKEPVENIEILVIGKKLETMIDFQLKKNKDKFTINYFDPNVKYFNSELKSQSDTSFINRIAEEIIEKITAQGSKISSIEIVYHKFKNIISRELESETILSTKSKLNCSLNDMELGEIEALKFYLEAKLSFYFYSNLCSILSTRMVTMDGASENAKDVHRKLFLEYNKIRQTKINRELLDIVSGLF